MRTQIEYFDAALDGAEESSGKIQALQPRANEIELHERLKYLVENTPAIIYSSVPSGDFKMTYVSSNARRILGYDPANMVADDNFWFEHIHPDDIPQIFSSLSLLFVEGERTYEYRFRDSQGNYIWMHDMLRLIRDEAGNPIEVIGSLTDISLRKAMEESLYKKGEEQKQLIQRLQEAQDQLLQSEKMASIGQLAAGIAHEINNPIGFVNSNLTTLQSYLRQILTVLADYQDLIPASLHAQLTKLRQAADLDFIETDSAELIRESLDGLKRVKDIVQSLKDFSHVGETEWQEADLIQGIESTLNIVYNEIKYKARIVKDYQPLPLVRCVISQINQVVMNLLVNASHAISEKGEISIRTGASDDQVWIAIKDNGAGIAPDHLRRIFEPFFTTKPIGKGTGLGLSLSYGIIKKHHGKIEVHSEVGKGSEFIIKLPVDPDKCQS